MLDGRGWEVSGRRVRPSVKTQPSSVLLFRAVLQSWMQRKETLRYGAEEAAVTLGTFQALQAECRTWTWDLPPLLLAMRKRACPSCSAAGGPAP